VAPVWEGLAGFVDAALEYWREPDQGIWEVRGEPKHFTASKVARAHGGWASAANQPGGGAVAAVQLPGTVYQPASTPSPGTGRAPHR
jgi:hypothetical protein